MLFLTASAIWRIFLGVSLVHPDKTLARLRAIHVAQWQGERIVVSDLQNLRAFAGLSHSESVAFA